MLVVKWYDWAMAFLYADVALSAASVLITAASWQESVGSAAVIAALWLGWDMWCETRKDEHNE